MTTTTPISAATTATTTKPSSQSPATTLSLDVTDLIRILQVQIPQLHNESILYEHKAQMEDTREQYRLLCKETDSLRKKLLAVVQDNNNHRKIQERMESQIYAQQQELAQVQKDSQTLTRQRKHLEKRLENELQNYESDRLLWQQREIDLSREVKRWSTQDRVGTPRRTRSATASNIFARTNNNNSLSVPESWTARNTGNSGMGTLFEGPTKSIDSVTARDTKIRVQEKLLSGFKNEIEHQKRVIHEAMLGAEAQEKRINTLEQELTSLKEVNASLMEDNESYQMLLHEKTMAGEFSKKSVLTIATEEEEIDKNTTTFNSDDNNIIVSTSFSSSSSNNTMIKKPKSTSLAAELNKVESGDDCNCQHADSVQKLSDEIRVLQESNKALSLYMNKILLKIVGNQELVDVLNIDEDDEGDDEASTFKSSILTSSSLSPSNNKIKDHTTQQTSPNSTPSPRSYTTGAIYKNNDDSKSNNRPRRSTISSWISAPRHPVISESSTTVGRHRSHTNNDGNNHHSNNNGGWSRALKRMTVIGWPSSKDSSNSNNVNMNSSNNNKNSKFITQANHDSAISSCESIILEE
ncbi:hypothetical protein INT45_009403 [Circinella minor]|uniref:Uncharacterized protein n=1 Tax=Circinella minor TaxID=1195481 RepID=A0A8H7RTD1_9FUNG|nr:hypothetical protein INT45_009403 [Circinella minor]